MSTGAGYIPYLNNLPDHAVRPQFACWTEASSAPYPSVYPSGSSYQPGPGYPATSGHLTAGHPASIRPSTASSSYTSEDEYLDFSAVHSYSQALPNPRAGGYRDPRENPMVYSRADPKDTRRVPNDARLDPTDLRADPRDLRTDPKDARLDTCPDPRTVPSNFSNVTSPGDVSTHGAVDHPISYDYVPSIASLQSDKGGSFNPSTVVPREYPRRSLRRREEFPGPDEQDHEPVRHEPLLFTFSLHRSRLIYLSRDTPQ